MVQVIGIGYGRTGTQSLQEALNLLGYKTFHSTQTMMLDRPDLLRTWFTNTTQKISLEDYCPIDLEELLQGYTAATGSLFSVCWENALRTYPEAHFILTTQPSSEDWYTSWSRYIEAVSLLPQYAPRIPRVREIGFYHRWLLSWIHQKDKSFFKFPHPLKQNNQLAQESYLQHIETVRRKIPPHQLLELEVGSEWEPLADFLNVSIPSGAGDYPHVGEQVLWQCRAVVGIANGLLMVFLFFLTKAITRLFKPKKKKKETVVAPLEPKVNVNQEETMKLDVPEEEEEEEYIPTVKIIGDDNDEDTPYLLSLDQMQQLAGQALPPMVALRRWKRLYRLSRDGDDFQTFLNATKGHAQTLLVIQTTKNQLLGAFVYSSWEYSSENRENYNINLSGSGFYGSTQACLFSFELNKSEKEESPDKKPLTVFKWSGLNRYIQLLDIHTGRVALGGGGTGKEQGFGLCIEDHFSKGTTAPCDTFNNPHPLTGDGNEQFAILDVEIWTFPHGTLG